MSLDLKCERDENDASTQLDFRLSNWRGRRSGREVRQGDGAVEAPPFWTVRAVI